MEWSHGCVDMTLARGRMGCVDGWGYGNYFEPGMFATWPTLEQELDVRDIEQHITTVPRSCNTIWNSIRGARMMLHTATVSQ
jgi:hypothetical protein